MATSGIRINQLAKELNVPSTLIIEKLRGEGLGDAAKNHMSVLKLGLAESVREWFSEGSGGTAIETAPPIEATSVKPKKVRPSISKKKVDGTHDHDASEESHGDESAAPAGEHVTPAPVVVEMTVVHPAPSQPVMPVVEEARIEPPVASVEALAPQAPGADAAPVAPLETKASEVPRPAPEAPRQAPGGLHTQVAPTVSPSSGAPGERGRTGPSAPAPSPFRPGQSLRPAAGAPGSPGAPPHRSGPGTPPPMRPTITLNNRGGQAPPQHTPVRQAVTPAPQLTSLKPATLQGPRVVRIEKPDVVPTPGPRRPQTGGGPGRPQDPTSTNAFRGAQARVGSGVKVTVIDDEEEKKKGRTLSNRRRGPDGRRGEADEKLKEFSEQDLIERRERLLAATQSRAVFDDHLNKSQRRGTHQQARTAAQTGGVLEVEEPITVKSLSGALGVKSNELILKLMRQGVRATINQGLELETASMIALEYGVELRIAKEMTQEEELLAEFEQAEAETEPEMLVTRSPVVTILGHVDHGKTSLLDKIRTANVAAGEAGGITQHTAAWVVETKGSDGTVKRVTFIDTPGHQAFTSMRARGANMTDVVVLVVAAVEGVMPQTLESINHARAAGVPIIVALNKIDRADANPDMVLGQLAGAGLNPVEWGGDTEVIRTSATTGQGIADLIEILDLQSQILELKADPTMPATGTVIEANMSEGLGAVATVLVQNGTLSVGDIILSGPGYGRIRALYNDRGESIKEAGPSTPVIVSGLGQLPGAGDKFFVLDDLERARSIAEERAELARQKKISGRNVVSLDAVFAQLRSNESQTINLIIKADVQGSLETLVATVTGQNTEEVKVRVIHSGVGAINESDVELAIATKGKPNDNRVAIIGFHVVPEDRARDLAEQNHVDVKTYRVIYEIFDDLKKSLSGMLAPETREKLHGHVEVRKVIKVSKIGNIAGCFVTDGHIQRGSKIRLLRDSKIIVEDLTIDTLRRVKDDVKEVKTGFECGIKLAGYDDIKEGDRFEAYVRETFQRTL